MSKGLEEYRGLERNLWLVRWTHEGGESTQEDAILDEMEAAWLKLEEPEREILLSEGPRCWPDDPDTFAPALDGEPSPATAWAYEGFNSPSEAILWAEAT